MSFICCCGLLLVGVSVNVNAGACGSKDSFKGVLCGVGVKTDVLSGV